MKVLRKPQCRLSKHVPSLPMCLFIYGLLKNIVSSSDNTAVRNLQKMWVKKVAANWKFVSKPHLSEKEGHNLSPNSCSPPGFQNRAFNKRTSRSLRYKKCYEQDNSRQHLVWLFLFVFLFYLFQNDTHLSFLIKN